MRPSGSDSDHPVTTPTKTRQFHRRRGLQRSEGAALAILAVVMAGGWLLALHG